MINFYTFYRSSVGEKQLKSFFPFQNINFFFVFDFIDWRKTIEPSVTVLKIGFISVVYFLAIIETPIVMKYSLKMFVILCRIWCLDLQLELHIDINGDVISLMEFYIRLELLPFTPILLLMLIIFCFYNKLV